MRREEEHPVRKETLLIEKVMESVYSLPSCLHLTVELSHPVGIGVGVGECNVMVIEYEGTYYRYCSIALLLDLHMWKRKKC